MGPSENPTSSSPNQARTRCRRWNRPLRRPRTRRCLLKGCEKRYHPRRARQRYCSPECREAARAWRRWKAQQRYRATAAGKQKRNGQSRRYRERRRNRQPSAPEAVSRTARVIRMKFFFRAPVTAQAATWSLTVVGDPRCNGSARRSVGGLGSVSGSGSNAGERRGQAPSGRKCFPRVRAGWRWARARGRSGDRLEILTCFPAFT